LRGKTSNNWRWVPLYQPKRRAPHRDPPRTLRVLTDRGERLGDAKLALVSQLMRSALMLLAAGAKETAAARYTRDAWTNEGT